MVYHFPILLTRLWAVASLLILLNCSNEQLKTKQQAPDSDVSGTVQVITILMPTSNPYLSRESRVMLTGTCRNEARVKINGAGIADLSCVEEEFSYLLEQDQDGTYNYTLVQELDGVISATPVTFTWLRDTSSPAPVTIDMPATRSARSASSTLELAGTCESGASVSLQGASTQTTLCTQERYAFDLSVDSDGTYSFSVTQTDPAGNVSASIEQVWQRDTQAPSAVTLLAPLENPFSSAIANSLVLLGTCEAGAQVNLAGDGNGQIVCPAEEQFTFTVEQTVDGSTTYTLQQMDEVGNLSPVISQVWIRDTLAPPAPIVLFPSQASYVSSETTFTLQGTCEAGAEVQLNITRTMAALSDSEASTTCSQAGTFAFVISKVLDDYYQLTLSQIDVVGNTSASVCIDWLRDTTAPDAVQLVTPVGNAIATADASLELSGTCAVEHTVVLGGSATMDMVCTDVGTFTFTVAENSDGTYTYVLAQVDDAGNTSLPTQVVWIKDTVAPAMVQLTSPSISPYTSADTALQLQGTCELGAEVSITGDDSATMACSDFGDFQFTTTKTLDGSYTLLLSQTDVAGNVSPINTLIWIRNTVVPDTPLLLAPVSQVIASNTDQLSLEVSCEQSIGAQVYLTGDVLPAEVISPVGVLQQSCMTGTVVFVVEKSLDGTYNFSLLQQHPLTNLQSGALSVQWSRDTVIPSAVVLAAPVLTPFTAPGVLAVAGTCERFATVFLTGAESRSSVCTTGSYAWTLTPGMDWTYAYEIYQVDGAGNQSDAVAFTWIRDSSSAVPVTVTTPASLTFTSNTASLLLQGTCSSGYTVNLSGDVLASEVITPTEQLSQVCQLDQFAFQISKAIEGSYNFTVIQSYGGVDSAAISVLWTRDTTAPISTILTTPPASNLFLASGFAFGCNDASATLQCKLDNDSFVSCTSPLSYASLTNGSHTFTLRALDSAGNLGQEVSHSWTQAAYQTVGLYHLDNADPLVDSSNYTALGGFANGLTAGGTPANNATGKYPTAAPTSRTMGTNNFYSAASNATWDTLLQTMTVEGFFRITAQPTQNNRYFTLVSKTGAANNLGWEVRLTRAGGGGSSRLVFVGSTNGVTYQITQQSNTITVALNTWYYFGVTWNKGQNQFFFGTTAATGVGTQGSIGTTALFGSTAALRLGANQTSGTNPSLWMLGALDELRISQVVRAAAFPASEFVVD